MKEQQEGYISNEYLRDLIIRYNRKNIDDTGNWCGPYRSKLNNKYAKAKEERPIIMQKLESGQLSEKEEKELKKKLSKLMTEEQYQASLNFITKKEKYIPELREMYMKLSPEERRHYNYELDMIKKEICEAFMKVINGRIISFKLVTTKDREDIEDIRQECLMTLFTYINSGYDKEPHRPCSVKRVGLDLSDRGNQTFDFGYPIRYGIQAIATDGQSLICANYGGTSLVNPAFKTFKKLTCPSFAEGFARVPKSIAKRETPVFVTVRALGGNMKGWRKDPVKNPPRLRLNFFEFDGEKFIDITENP